MKSFFYKRLFILVAFALFSPSNALAQQYLICIDPGHGGTDPGAVGCGLEEADVVLDVALKLRTLLVADGFSVIMTRDDDSTVSLASRVDYANSQSANRFVAIHANSATTIASGIETYCYTGGSQYSIDMRDKIQEEMVAAWPLPNRGGKTANFYVLANTSMPATLSELAFINNCSVDATYLGDANERQRAATAHLRALQRHFGKTPTDPPVEGSGTVKGVVFEDKGVGYADMTTRLTGATVTVKETGEMQTAQGADALWSFTLKAGKYTFRASFAGYKSGERSCDVLADQTTWCSIGLFKEDVDAGVTDAGEQDTGTTDTGEPDVPEEDVGIEFDVGVDVGGDDDDDVLSYDGGDDTGNDEGDDASVIGDGEDDDALEEDVGGEGDVEEEGDDDDNDDNDDNGDKEDKGGAEEGVEEGDRENGGDESWEEEGIYTKNKPGRSEAAELSLSDKPEGGCGCRIR
ncbi:MAG: hypothetical protein Kow0090_10010 [Myxococcota bacterium]